MLDLKLFSIWKGRKPKNSYVNFHSHNYYELVYYSYGNGKTKIGNDEYAFSDGSFALIPPYVSHVERHQSDAEVICLIFFGCPDLAQSFGKDSFNTIHAIMKSLFYEAKNQDFGYRDMINIKLNELYMNILRNKKTHTVEKNSEYVINYLKENFHEKIVLSDCAKQLNLSYDYFQHKFKKITGYSPQQFLLKQRLIASEGMLQSGNLSCTEIADHCGFSTSAQYSALFKKEYGLTPLQYRKRAL